MRNGLIVAAAVVTTAGLLAITARLLLKQAAERSAQKSREILRWEDDGGNLPAHVPSAEPQSA